MTASNAGLRALLLETAERNPGGWVLLEEGVPDLSSQEEILNGEIPELVDLKLEVFSRPCEPQPVRYDQGQTPNWEIYLRILYKG